MLYDKIFFERACKADRHMSVTTRMIVEQYKKKHSLVQQVRKTKQVQLAGESMLPVLDPSKILTLLVSDCCDPQIGDVVVFEYKHSVFGLAVHRIIRKTGSIITTKGDNNLQCDESVDLSAIIGKVEKALMKDMSIVTIKSSVFVAWLSRVESSIVKWMPKRLAPTLHRGLLKLYTISGDKEGDNR